MSNFDNAVVNVELWNLVQFSEIILTKTVELNVDMVRAYKLVRIEIDNSIIP